MKVLFRMPLTDAPVRFDETATCLHEGGWRPVPAVAETKRGAIKGWPRYNKRPHTDEGLPSLIESATLNGWACALTIQPEIVGVDLDEVRPDKAARLRKAADDILRTRLAWSA